MYFRPITGDDLKRMRLSCNRSTEEMARIAGVKRKTYERWERGETEPKMNQSYRMQMYCKFDLTPIYVKYDNLKDQFSQYKNTYETHDKPNQHRVSDKKNFLKEEPQEQQPHDEPKPATDS